MTSWNKTEPRYASIPGVDPAVDWALGEGNDYFFASHAQRQWMPILVQLKQMDAREFQDGKQFLERAEQFESWRSSVRVSKLYTEPAGDAEPFRFCTALVTREFFEFLLTNPDLRRFVARVTLGLPLDRDSLPAEAFRSSGESQP
jgi:hypothetical protein